jgi:3-dehydroquinate synthetase
VALAHASNVPLSENPPDRGSWQQLDITLGSNFVLPYYYGYNCLPRIAARIAGLDPDRIAVVTDDRVRELHGDALLAALGEIAPTMVLSTPPGESAKTFQVLGSHLERAIYNGLTRRSVIVCFGGGVVGNLGGLLAALLFRGIRLIHVPTTIMAATDAVISLKQTVNSPHGKNHIGTYYRPTAVLTDLKLLRTLPANHLRSGLCEMVKNCLAIRPALVQQLAAALGGDPTTPQALEWLLVESITAKASVMAQDEREQHAGLVLEYGHTVGHAIELHAQRRPGAHGLSHGEAVGIGLLVAAEISADRGWLTRQDVQAHLDALRVVRGPERFPDWLDAAEVLRIVQHDNKRGYLPISRGQVPFVLLKRLGEPAWTADYPLTLVALSEVARAIDRARYLDEPRPGCLAGGTA